MTRLPAANASAVGWTTRESGKFQGPMMPTTPSGWLSTTVGWVAPATGAGAIHSPRWSRACWMLEVTPATLDRLNSSGRCP